VVIGGWKGAARTQGGWTRGIVPNSKLAYPRTTVYGAPLGAHALRLRLSLCVVCQCSRKFGRRLGDRKMRKITLCLGLFTVALVATWFVTMALKMERTWDVSWAAVSFPLWLAFGSSLAFSVTTICAQKPSYGGIVMVRASGCAGSWGVMHLPGTLNCTYCHAAGSDCFSSHPHSGTYCQGRRQACPVGRVVHPRMDGLWVRVDVFVEHMCRHAVVALGKDGKAHHPWFGCVVVLHQFCTTPGSLLAAWACFSWSATA
jgi:hypothetical protein